MATRVEEITEKLNIGTEDAIEEVLTQLKEMKDLSAEEKIKLAGALTSFFYHHRHADSSRMLKLAIRMEKRLAGFGSEIVPFLLNEMADVDGESAAYLGKALEKIGQPAIDQMCASWNNYESNEPALINLLQAVSYFSLPDGVPLVPFLVRASGHANFQVVAMAIQAMGRVMESGHADRSMVASLFEICFRGLSFPQPLVRKNAVRALGKMQRKHLLSDAEQARVREALRSITGKDDKHNWDRAFIVRKEADAFIGLFQQQTAAVHAYVQSFKILSKQLLCTQTYHYVVEAPLIARRIQAGQFVIIRPHDKSERIPLSICGWDREAGHIHIIVSAVGKTSTEINRLEPGDCLKDIVGPLGERSHLPDKKGTCVVIGGGYGTGAVIPTAQDLKANGHKVYGIVGARTADMLIMTEQLKASCDEVLLTTNDGSAGRKGLVTDALQEIMMKEDIVHVLAVGPVPMMRAVSEMTRPFKIETYVSLNAIMVDGTGMCGACRVSVGQETKFACFHGPDFDGHLVDFDNLMKRQKMFVKEEKLAFEILK